jgi:hypothetical protein
LTGGRSGLKIMGQGLLSSSNFNLSKNGRVQTQIVGGPPQIKSPRVIKNLLFTIPKNVYNEIHLKSRIIRCPVFLKRTLP